MTFPERFSTGIIRFKVKFNEKKEFIQNYCLSICNEVIQDFLHGLDIFDLKTFLKNIMMKANTSFFGLLHGNPKDFENM